MTSEEEADHCTDSAFPYLYNRRQHADCQAPKGIAFCRFLWYPCLQERRCSASAAVMLPSSVSLFVSSSGGSPIFCHPPDGSIVLHEILEGGFHHGSFKYCFFRTEPFGYSRHRRHQCDVDDLKGCLSGQTSGKTLFEKTLTRKMTARSSQTSAVMFSNVTSREGS